MTWGSARYSSRPAFAPRVGFLAERGWDRHFGRAVAALAVGQGAFYAIDLFWLALSVGAARAMPLGLLPFLPGDALKLLVAATVLPSGWRFLARIGPQESGSSQR